MSEETIGTRIAKLRNEFTYSQEYVAEKLGVSRQAVSKWEQNQSSPDTNNLIALAELFNVTVEYLAIGKTQVKEEKPQIKSIQKIVGYILLGAGLLSLILGIIIDVFLMIASAYFIIIGIVCIVARKNFVLVLLCTLAITILLGTILLTNRAFGFNMVTLVRLCCILVLTVVIVIALIKFIKKKIPAKKEKVNKN